MPESEPSEAEQDASPGPIHERLGGRYHILKKLGSGSMGDVYLAEDSKLERRVAVKAIRADRYSSEAVVKRIKRECLLHAKIGAHPHIVTLFDLIDDNDAIHLIMEYVEGETLQDLLERYEHSGSRLPLEDCIAIATQCLSALSHTHAHGIVHRDMKPANIILAPDESVAFCVKVMDFGIARMETNDPDATTLTRPGERSPGTPLYMAPEQIDSETYGAVTHAADLYAVGVLLYHLIAGRPPFRGTLTDVFNGHLNFMPKPITLESGKPIPNLVMAAIEKAMAKRPDERFASAKAFEKELNSLLSSTASTTGTGTPGRRSRVRWAVVAVLTLATAIGAGLVLRGPSDTVVDKEVPATTIARIAGPKVVTLEDTRAVEHAPAGTEAPIAPSPASVETPVSDTGVASVEAEETFTEPRALDAVEEAALSPVQDPAKPPEGMPPSEAIEPPGDGGPSVEQQTLTPAPLGREAPAPPEFEGKTYTVASGDTISKIAQKFDLDKNDLAKWNLLEKPNALAVGQVLYLYERPGLPDIEIDWGAEESWARRKFNEAKEKVRQLRGGKGKKDR